MGNKPESWGAWLREDLATLLTDAARVADSVQRAGRVIAQAAGDVRAEVNRFMSDLTGVSTKHGVVIDVDCRPVEDDEDTEDET